MESVVDELIEKELYPSRRRIESLLPEGVIVKEKTVKMAWKNKLNEDSV